MSARRHHSGYGIAHLLQLQRLHRPLEANRLEMGVHCNTEPGSDGRELAAPHNALCTRNRSQPDLCVVFGRFKCLNVPSQIVNIDVIAIDRPALSRGRRNNAENEDDYLHRVILFTCEYMSSAALTTFEFASYARWLTIMLMNSSTTLTFEPST